ncbi:metal ABC transporter solute-binding protein, Zn/Mn family [Campylobacter mucosalis]|uniref:metal ABC transporter solute-binding protein, Zn/Mn family n=1 Tax=Campylobacter mucosalis TaxID=202 RepID=UPI00147037DA|nr:zinc ABC transporter substrate-binding protein [Campylobacter mucosalis]
MNKILFALLASCLALFAKPQVSASILPTKYFIEQIAGDTLSVNVLTNKGDDPHTYEPKPKQMKELENSVLYFAIGIEFEDVWLKKFEKNYPNLKIIHTENGIEKIAMTQHEHDHEHGDIHHEHGKGCGHSHGGLDPHVWLDPILVKTQAKNIADALISEFPQNEQIYRQNLEAFNAKLDQIDSYIRSKFQTLKSNEFIVYHPSWGYFAKRYGLEQLAIEIEGKEPKPSQLAELISEAKEHKIRIIFTAPNFSKKAAQLVAKQSGADVYEVDQLPYEWESVMKQMADILGASLSN